MHLPQSRSGLTLLLRCSLTLAPETTRAYRGPMSSGGSLRKLQPCNTLILLLNQLSISRDLSEYYGYIGELTDFLLELFAPAECVEYMDSQDRPRPLVIRANTIKTTRKVRHCLSPIVHCPVSIVHCPFHLHNTYKQHNTIQRS